MPKPRVLALIVDYYSSAQAAELSLQLAGATNVQVEIAHIDNGMSPPVRLSAQQTAKGVRLVRNDRNLGYGGGLNAAIAQLDPDRKFDAYWLLNPDLRVEPECLSLLLPALFEYDRVGAVGPVVRIDRPPYRVWGARGIVSPWLGTTAMSDYEDRGPLPQWSYIPGCSLLIRAEAFRDAGGLPEFYKLYYEESHLCIRLQKRGWSLRVVPDAVAYHRVDSMKAGVPARHFAYYFAQ